VGNTVLSLPRHSTMAGVPAPAEPIRRLETTGRRAATAAALAAVVVTALSAVGTASGLGVRDPGTAVERGLPGWLLLVGVGVLLTVAVVPWVVRAEHPGAAVGLAVGTVASLVPVWAGWPWLPTQARALALAACYLVVGGLAQVALRWSSGSPSAALRATYLLGATAAVVHAAAYNPFADRACSRICQDVGPPLEGLLGTRAAVWASSVLAVLAVVVAVTAIRRRPVAAPPTVRLTVVLSLAALAAWHLLRAGGWGGARTQGLLVVLTPCAVVLVGLAVGAVAARTARARAAVDDLIRQLAESQLTTAQDSGFARAVHFAVPAEGRWVDADGADAAEPEPRARVVVLSDSSGPVLRMLLAPGAEAGDVLARLTPARRLALANARLTAAARAHLADLQASQHRAVYRADVERRRIERDLHDGAQQRLVSASFYLSAARARVGPHDVAALDARSAELRDTLTHLRSITHGMFPDVLADARTAPRR